MIKQNIAETPNTIYGKRTNYAEEVLFKALGESYIEYRKKWVKASKRELVTEFPLYIQIEHIGKCNLRCPTCIQGIDSIRKTYSHDFKPLDIELYKKIIDEAKQYKCPSIAFHNNDEPLLLNDLEERIRLAKEAGFLDIIMTTNATLLNKKRALKLLKTGITKINFSVDSFNEEDYSQRRLGGDFNTVLSNINYFTEHKKKQNLKLPITRATCVLTKHSVVNMDKFREFWMNKVDMVEFQNFQAIKNWTEGFKSPTAKVDTDFICNAPWQQLVIRANGDVLSCCSFYGIEMIVGNIKKSSLYDIWNSALIAKIRKELLKNNFNFSSVCKKCSETRYVI
ncbi:radical SAM/SPASM domain-containing protein [Candidatus Omnitrophota bacterium]